MVALNEAFASSKTEATAKNRVGDFFCKVTESVGEDRRSTRKYTEEKQVCGYDIASSHCYGPFGELIRATGEKKDAFNFRFSTKYEDAETGLLYYGYRYYNAETGRWLNRDPIGEAGGLNLYGMLGNDPVNLVDALGLADPATFRRAITILNRSLSQCKCCPKVVKLLEARINDIFDKIDDDALDHLINYTNQFSEKASEYVKRSESITDPIDKALNVVDFLEGGYNIEFHEGAVDGAGKISSNLKSVSKNIKKLGLVGKVTSQTAAIVKGDAISAALTIGEQLSPPGVSDFLNFYGEGYRASVEAIENISFFSNSSLSVYKATGDLCRSGCDLAEISLKSAYTGIR